jgi:hypothetical protein
MRFLVIGAVGLALAACAQGTGPAGDDDDDTRPDARVDGPLADAAVDAPDVDGPDLDGPVDAATDGPVVDAAVDAATDGAPIDGPVVDGPVVDAPIDGTPIDAPIDAPCTPTTMQILINPAFDGAPIGTGWVDQPFDPGFPLITPDDGAPEHTAPNKAWLGGWLGEFFGPNATDQLYQQVVVPAGTTALSLRGQYWVATDESPGSTVYDDSRVELLNSSGGLLQSALTVSNVGPTTGWTPFQTVFGNAYAGQTVRVRFRSSNDFSLATSFFYDSVALEATIACP